MKALGTLVLVLSLSSLSVLSTVRAEETSPACPLASAGETTLDCPWAGIARQVAPATTPAEVEEVLSEVAPGFLQRIAREGKKAGDVKKLWGRSINFDENAKAIIIPPALIDVILAKAGVPARVDRIVYAGFEHTYGYLLSILKTPYGYKRLRWVRPDIEKGFGLEPGVISPTPKHGGLFMNVSEFAGRIAFQGKNWQDRAALKTLCTADGVARSLRRFDYRTLHGRRLTETVALDGGRTVEIRTDFVPFTKAKGEATGGNSELLVYSIRDSAEKYPYLISAFPIAAGFSEAALDPKNLGEDKPIITRYNAFVPGVTDAKAPRTGKRSASTF
jgi:hypothetical protein